MPPNPTPKPWTFLSNEDGDTMVVVPSEDTKPIQALIEALVYHYGGEWDEDTTNPVLLREAAHLKVERWRYMTKAMAEAEGVDYEDFNGYWAPHGDGKRSIWAFNIETDLYTIGDEAVDWEKANPPPDASTPWCDTCGWKNDCKHEVKE